MILTGLSALHAGRSTRATKGASLCATATATAQPHNRAHSNTMLASSALLLVVGSALAQHEGDYLQLFKCGSTAAELFEQHHQTLADARNWTTIRMQHNASLCVTACSNCDPATSRGHGRLQLQACTIGSTAQAWSLVAGGAGSVQVETSKAFVQSSKCVGWNICPASTSTARPVVENRP